MRSQYTCNETGNFKMRPFDAPQENTEPVAVPEPGSVLGLLALGFWGLSGMGKRQ